MSTPRASARWPTPESREVEERRHAEEEAKRRASREGIEQAEREAAEARRKAEEERHRHEEEAKRKAELEAKKRFGEAEAAAAPRPAAAAAPATAKTPAPARTPATPSIRAPGIAAEPEEDEGPRQIRRGPGGAMRPVAAPKTTHKPAPQKQRGRLTRRHRAQCRRGARALDRLVPPPHPAPEGSCVERAEGKADSRSDRFPKRSPSRNSPTACRSARSTSSAS